VAGEEETLDRFRPPTGDHFFLDAVAGTLLACLTGVARSRRASTSRQARASAEHPAGLTRAYRLSILSFIDAID
jgi:hypothetical protein